MIETWYNQDIMQPVKVHYLDGNVFSQDNNGNKIGVNLFSGDTPVNVSGTVSANVIRSDGATVAVTGDSSGNAAWVTLPQSAYAVPGVISVIIKETDNGNVTTVCAMVANVYRASTDAVVDPGTIIPSVETLIDEIETAVASIPSDYSDLWKTVAPNFSTDTAYFTGQYVTYDGKVYRFVSDHAAGSWNSSHVVAVSVGGELYGIRSTLDGVYYAKLTALGTANKARLQCSAGDTLTIRTGDSSLFTVGKLNLLDAGGNVVGYYNLSSANDRIRNVTTSKDCEYVDIENGTVQDIVVVNQSKILSNALAAVKVLSNGENLNELYCAGWFIGSYSHAYTNAPESSNGRKMVFVVANGVYQYYQIYINYTTGAHYERYYADNAWSAWKVIGDGFVKALANNEDLDGLYLNGWYSTSYSHAYQHSPDGSTNSRREIWISSGNNSATNIRYMHYVNFTTGNEYIRMYADGAWTEWKVIGGGLVKTLANNDDLDSLYLTGWYSTSYAHSYQHSPDGASNNRREIWISCGNNSATAFRYMHYYNYSTNRAFVRMYHDGAWDEWKLESGGGSSGSALISGAAYDVRFPLNATYDSAQGDNYDPYTYHQKVVTLLHCSDIHSHAGEFQTLMEWANDNTSLYDDIIFTGDIVEYYNESTGTDYMAFWKAVNNANKILVTIGNHDAKNQQVSSVANWERKTMARSRELYMYGIDGWGVTSPTGKTYWYKDYSNSDMRLIGLDTTVVHGGDDDTAQQTWLTNVLADAKTNSKQVVIAEHYQPESATKVSSDFTATNRAVSYNQYMSMPPAYYGIVQTFIDGGGKFICWIAGHTHTDYVAYNSNYPNQIFFVVTSLWNDLRTSDQARTSGTPSFIAANLIGFDTERKLIKIARVGANYDYNLRPREVLVYNYDTKTIVRQTSGD